MATVGTVGATVLAFWLEEPLPEPTTGAALGMTVPDAGELPVWEEDAGLVPAAGSELVGAGVVELAWVEATVAGSRAVNPAALG